MFNDIQYAVRRLGRQPGFTTAAVLSLALGIAVNIMIFSVFNAAFLRPVPGVQEPHRLVNLKRTHGFNHPTGFPYADFELYRDQNSVFSGMFCYRDEALPVTLADPPVEPRPAGGASNQQEIRAMLVSSSYFPVLGVRAVLGRIFLPGEDLNPGSHPVVVLSHRLWVRRYGADPAVLGKTVRFNSVAFTVIGVAPAGFSGLGDLRATDAWMPLTMMGQLDQPRDWNYLQGAWWFQMTGRLRPGVSLDQALPAMKVLHAQITQRDFDAKDTDNKPNLGLQPTGTFAPLVESLEFVLPIMGGVTLLLVIACANVANLLLARSVGRRKEMGIRVALGASRSRLIRLLLVESALIALTGAALGLLFGSWGSHVAWTFICGHVAGIEQLFVNLDLNPDARTVAYATLLAFVTSIIFGLAPALEASRLSPNTALKEAGALLGRQSSGSKLRNFFVVAQVAACLTLLVGIGQLLAATWKSSSIKFGYEPKDVILAQFDLDRHGYSNSRALAFYNQLTERMRALPGVASVSLARNTLARNRHVDNVGPDYFAAMKIPILRGRTFTETESRQGLPVAIISEATAGRLWPGTEPLGQRLTNAPYSQIIGVVGNVRNLREVLVRQPAYTPELPGAGHDDYLYYPAVGAGGTLQSMSLLVKTRGEPTAVMAAVRREADALDPGLLVTVGRLTDDARDSLNLFGIFQKIAGLIGVIALTLAAMGIYAVMAYAVSQRTREIGIRMALGAQRGAVVRLILGKGVWLIVSGIMLGLPAAAVLSGLLSSALIEVRSLPPVMFAGVSLVLGAAMLLACYIPARRATKVDPMIALRCE